MPNRINSRSAQALAPVRQAPSKPAARFSAVWLADPPTWALQRYAQTRPEVPVAAIVGQKVVGSNAVARKAGVRPGESLSRALQLCRQLEVHPHDHPAVLAAWDTALATAYTYSPWVEPVQLGLAMVGGLSPQEAAALAQALQARVGQAESRSSAQLAALLAPEGGSKSVVNENAFIAQVPLYALQGLGFEPPLLERLRLFGVEHLADIHRLGLSQKQLEAQFKAEGRRLYAVAHGQFTAPIQRYQVPWVAHKRWAFEDPVLEPQQFLPILGLLVAQAAMELGQKVCWTLSVGIHYPKEQRLGRRVLGAPTQKPKALLGVAERIFWDVHCAGAEIEALEVTLGRVVLPPVRVQDLFRVFQRPPVWAAVEQVDQRFSGSIGRLVVEEASRFREEGWRYQPLGSSQEDQVGEGRRLL